MERPRGKREPGTFRKFKTAGTIWRDGLKVQIVNNKNVYKVLGI